MHHRGKWARTGLPIKSDDRKELGFFIDAFEPHQPPILESDTGPRNEIAEDTRDQHFVRGSDTDDPRTGDHHQPCNLRADDFGLPHVEPATDL